jgi:hypothetical protein
VILNNWLRRFRSGAPLCAFSARSWNRICNVLESIEGVGCRIEKTENGWGWQIVVGDGSDAEPPPGFPSGLPDASGLPDEDPPPCGHPGNEPGAGGGDGDGDDTEHPGDEPGAGGDSTGDDTDHPGDDPSPPSSGECAGE